MIAVVGDRLGMHQPPLHSLPSALDKADAAVSAGTWYCSSTVSTKTKPILLMLVGFSDLAAPESRVTSPKRGDSSARGGSQSLLSRKSQRCR